MVIAGKAEEVVLRGMENSRYLSVGGEHPSFRTAGKWKKELRMLFHAKFLES